MVIKESTLRTISIEKQGVLVSFEKCLYCRFFDIGKNIKEAVCIQGENVTDCRNQICDKWRYSDMGMTLHRR